MNLDQAIAPARPILILVGQILIIVGLLKFFGVQIPVSHDGLQLAFAGWLLKNI